MKAMKLYLIVRPDNGGYDTYDSAVVCASSPLDARHVHPTGRDWLRWDETWVSPDRVKVIYIGRARCRMERGVVVASFNAG